MFSYFRHLLYVCKLHNIRSKTTRASYVFRSDEKTHNIYYYYYGVATS